MYFENVGGIHFAASMECLNNFGRVAVCGMIDIYNDAIPEPCNFWPMKMIYSSQRVEGFISFAWLSGKKGGDWLGSMHKWLSEGKINIKESQLRGLRIGLTLSSLSLKEPALLRLSYKVPIIVFIHVGRYNEAMILA